MPRLLVPALAALLGVGTVLVPAEAEARPRTTSAIVFVSDRDSPPGGPVQDDLYLYDVRTRQTSRLTNDPRAESFTALAPDGRHVAFLTTGGINVCAIRRAGAGWTCGSPRGVVSYPEPTGGKFAWTPDGRSIVYAGTTSAGPDLDIYLVDVESLDPPTNLTAAPPGEPEVAQSQPTVSPDGRFIVYGQGSDLWRRRIDGSHPVQLTNTPAPAIEFGPEFSPDGRRLAFHSNRKAPSNPGTDDFDIYLMKPRPESADNAPVDVTAGVTAPGGGASRERFPTFSPSGGRLAFWWSVGGGQADLDSGEIYTVRVDGTDPANLTDNNAPDPSVAGAGDITPDWGRVRR